MGVTFSLTFPRLKSPVLPPSRSLPHPLCLIGTHDVEIERHMASLAHTPRHRTPGHANALPCPPSPPPPPLLTARALRAARGGARAVRVAQTPAAAHRRRPPPRPRRRRPPRRAARRPRGGGRGGRSDPRRVAPRGQGRGYDGSCCADACTWKSGPFPEAQPSFMSIPFQPPPQHFGADRPSGDQSHSFEAF